MFCTHCGSNNADKAKFCLKCGKPVDVTATAKPPKVRVLAIACGVIAVLATVSGYVMLGPLFFIGSNPNLTSTTKALDENPAVRRVPIATHHFVVKPASYSWFAFQVPQAARIAKVNGKFSVQGGSGNDIYCFITDADGFTNFQNGHKYPMYFNSGKVTVKTLDVRLPIGSYCVVFNNSFSLVSNKAITADLVLEYLP